jgi:diguanylate cyclase (GGDEF)-like protein
MKLYNTNKFIFLILILLIGFVLYLQYLVQESTEKLRVEELKKTETYAANIVDLLKHKIGKKMDSRLAEDPQLRHQLNEILEVFLIPKYQYIFLLTKDTKGHYRFLLDGSKDDKEAYHALFFPRNRAFDRVYNSKEVKIIRQQDDVKGVWLSLLYPIVIDGKTESLLVMDLSQWYGEYIENFNSPLKGVIWLMQLFLIASLLFLLLITYRYYVFRKRSLLDPLTSAHTKLYMEEFFNRNRIEDYNALLVDIDEFKEINRNYGYEKGDMVLKEFVETLRKLLPDDAFIIRIGGAEFFIFFTKSESLNKVARSIFLKMKEKRYLIDNDVIKMTLSISALEVPVDTLEIQHVLRTLDEELLKIKSKGKNSLSVLNLQSHNEIKHKNIDYIKKALEEERLICHFQPIFKTEDKTIQKYEALVRLVDEHHPDELIMPYVFLNIIKGTTQYIKMSKQVLNQVFTMLEKYPDTEFSVNLDLDDLYNMDMMEMIVSYLSENRHNAKRVTFEILEKNEIEDYERANFIFSQLKAYGSKIAIDDFGSGFANYNYLIRLNVDILKIDGSLIRELTVNPERARAVLSSIRSLADTFGFELVAEFVSSEEIYREVHALNIHYVQGYYLGEPRPIEMYMEKTNLD